MHPEFPSVLCRRFVSILLSSDLLPNEIDQRPDTSYHTYLACWVKWFVDTCRSTLPGFSDLRKEILSSLMKALSNGYLAQIQNQDACVFFPPIIHSLSTTIRPFELLKALSIGQEDLESLTKMLQSPQWQPSPAVCRYILTCLPSLNSFLGLGPTTPGAHE